MKTPVVIFILLNVCCASSLAQDSVSFRFSHDRYKESVLTFGYNYNFGDKKESKRPDPLHFIELGFWKSSVTTGHHSSIATYYVANDFRLNTNNFVVGPKVGAFFSVMILGIGSELCYYTDFNSGSLRFIPSIGLFTQYFKLTINPHIPITNKDFQNINKGHANLTVRIFKIKRTDMK